MREALDECIDKNEQFDNNTQKKKDQVEMDVQDEIEKEIAQAD